MIKTLLRGVTRNFKFILLIAVVLTSTFAFAQKETGAIQGTVRDNDGRPIAGVTATASSPSLIGGRTQTYTDQNGAYRFLFLAPGVYEVQALLDGFQTEIRRDVRVFVGRTISLDFSLELMQTAVTVEVSDNAPLIDVTTSAVSHTVPVEIIENVPKRGSIEDLLALTPGIGDDLVAHGGAEGGANALWIDGVDFDNPMIGGREFTTPMGPLSPLSTATVAYNYNWIQEAQIASLAAGPAYGGFTGALANFITRSGSNDVHGLMETFFQNEHLISVNRPDGKTEPRRLYDVSTQLGGPILRDKLWFFTGLQYAYNQRQPFDYAGKVTETYPKFITKLTSKLNENNTLQGFASYNYHQIDGDGAGSQTLPEATSIDTCHEASWNSTWISLLKSQTTFEGRFGGVWSNCKELPRNGDLPSHLVFPPGIHSVNAVLTHFARRLRPQVNATLSHHADNFLKGNHDFQFGVEWERSTASEMSRYNGGYSYSNYYGSLSRYGAPEGLWNLDGNSNHRISAFASDSWRLFDQVTLDLGVRWDHNRGITDLGTVFKTDPVAPRLGLVWRSKSGYPTDIKLHYGDYYEALRGIFYATVSNGRKPTLYEVFENGEWRVGGGVSGGPATMGPNIKQPRVREFTLGMDQEFANGIAVGATYIHRTWENILAQHDPLGVWTPVPFVNPLTGETMTIFSYVGPGVGTGSISNEAGLFRRYNGIEFFANAHLFRNFTLSASFDYSKIKGNVENNSNNYVYVFASHFNNPNREINNKGQLVNDPTFAWKLVGTYKLPLGFNTGWYFRHASGDRWAPIILPRSTVMIQRPGFILLLPRGTYQLPSTNILDLRVEKEFQLSQGQFRVTADIFNLFNAATVTQVDNFYPYQGEPYGFTDARTVQLGFRYTF